MKQKIFSVKSKDIKNKILLKIQQKLKIFLIPVGYYIKKTFIKYYF